jgi:hypothetical protein
VKKLYNFLVICDSRSETYSYLPKKIIFYSIFTIGMILFFIPFVIRSIISGKYSKEQKEVMESWKTNKVKEYREKN